MFHTSTADFNKCCFDLNEVIAVERVNSKDCKVLMRGGGEIIITIDYKIMVNVLENH